MLKKILSNSSGSVMVQVMVAASLVIGGAAYILNSNQNQNKLRSGVARKITQSVIQKEISEILSSSDICSATLKKKGELSNDLVLDGLYNKDDQLIYGPNQELYNNTITELKLTDYIPGAGPKYQISNIQVTVKSKETQGKSYGANTRNYKIPLFLLTEDNVVDTCMYDGAGSILSALKKACEELKGTFNESTARCENFHGENGSFIKHIREYLCSTSGVACVHPYQGQTCSGVDVRGEDHGNWVISGFDGNGQKECQCVPVQCPNPALYCLGRNLGTNWCDQVCPVGAKTDGACAPPSTPPATTGGSSTGGGSNTGGDGGSGAGCEDGGYWMDNPRVYIRCR